MWNSISERKGSTLIMLMVVMVVVIVAFLMMGGGFKGIFSDAMGGLGDLANNSFSNFLEGGFGSGGFKIEIDPNGRKITNIKVYSKGEKIIDKKNPGSDVGVPIGNEKETLVLRIFYRNILNQEVKLESDRFLPEKGTKVNLSAAISKGTGEVETRKGKFKFIENAEVKKNSLKLNFPDYIKNQEAEPERELKEGNEWKYDKFHSLKFDQWDRNGKGLIVPLELNFKMCVQGDHDLLLLTTQYMDERIVFENPFPNKEQVNTMGLPVSLPTEDNRNCISFSNIKSYAKDELTSAVCAGSYPEYSGWHLVKEYDKYSADKLFIDPNTDQERDKEMKIKGLIYRRLDMSTSDKGICKIPKKGRVKEEDAKEIRGPFKFRVRYRMVCPAGYKVEKLEKREAEVCKKLEKL